MVSFPERYRDCSRYVICSIYIVYIFSVSEQFSVEATSRVIIR